MHRDVELTCKLPNIEFLAVTGADAGDFLQRQTTQDTAPLVIGGSTYGAWLDARGRVRALLRILRLRDRWMLAVADQSAAALAADLRVFVLRSAVELAVESTWSAVARRGDVEDWHSALASAPTRDTPGLDAPIIVELAPALFHLYGPAGRVAALAGPATGNAQAAIAAEIEHGIPSLPPSIAQSYTAHMLNLDTLGAIAFDKGCYPGQEVTARTHNLGTVKRRARPFRCAASGVPPGTEVVDATDAPVGNVVRAASVDRHGFVLAVVQLEHTATPLYLALDGRPPLEPMQPTP